MPAPCPCSKLCGKLPRQVLPVLGLLLLLGACQHLWAQQVVLRAKLDGQAEPLAGMPLYFQELGSGKKHLVLTNGQGKARSPFDGASQVRAELVGYHPVVDTLQPGENLELLLRPNHIALPEQVVTGQLGTMNESENLYSIRVLNRKRIEAQGATNLRDLLRTELNIRLQEDSQLGTDIRIMGLGGQLIKVMIDGVPIIGRQDGFVDLGQINLQDIERIEIVEGPMAVNYGTDALGGVINLITKKDGAKGLSGSLTAYAELVEPAALEGRFNLNGLVNYRSGPHQVQASLGRNFFHGWSPQDDGRQFLWNPREQYQGGLRYHYSGQQLAATYQLRGFQETLLNRGAAVITPESGFAFDEYYQTYRLDNSLNLRHGGGGQPDRGFHHLLAHNWFRRTKETLRKDLVTLEATPSGASDASDTSTFQLYLYRGTYTNQAPKARLSYQFGLESSVETGAGERMEAGDQLQADVAAFASVEWRAHSTLTVRPGLRWGWNSAFQAPLIPSLNLRWRPHPNWTLRASYGRGFRAPSLKEQYLLFVDVNHNIQGNEDLEAEYAHSLSGAVVWKKLWDNWVFQAEYAHFYNSLRNRITLALAEPETNLFTYVNLDNFRTQGGRLQLRLLHASLEVQSGLSVTGLMNDQAPQTAEAAPPRYSFNTEFNLNLGYQLPWWKLKANVFYKYTGRLQQFQLVDENTLQESFIDPFHTLDVSLVRSFWNDRIRLTLGVRNLANVTNINQQIVSGAHSGGGGAAPVATGRNAFTQLVFSW